MVDVLQYRADVQPAQTAYTFLADGDTPSASLTFGELDQQARRIAGFLQQRKLEDKAVLLLYPPGLDFITAFFGCFYARAIPVPMYPPRRNRRDERFSAVAVDAGSAFALTTKTIADDLDRRLNNHPEVKALQWAATDDFAAVDGYEWRQPDISSAQTAFLQYTSGSTRDPHGVVVSHANVLHNQETIRKGFSFTNGFISAGWLPMFHDLGLVGHVIQPPYLGGHCIMMPPTAFLQRPMRLIRAISRFRAMSTSGPNFMYRLCADDAATADLSSIDLSCWKIAINGAESVRRDTMDRFVATFGCCGFDASSFCPCYGLAEATLMVTCGRRAAGPAGITIDPVALASHTIALSTEPDATSVVSCGKPILNERIAIVASTTRRRCDQDKVGEIWISGSGVAQGYWNKPGETQTIFRATIEGEHGEFYLRTGDLGFTVGGELYVVGRCRDLIVVRGVNHHPQDIERTATHSHEALEVEAGAAFTVGQGGDDRVILACEVRRRALRAANKGAITSDIADAVRRSVGPRHGLSIDTVLLMRPGTIPRTSSGKIRRQSCKARFLANQLDPIAVCAVGSTVGIQVVSIAASSGAATPYADTADAPETRANVADAVIAWLRWYARHRIDSPSIDRQARIPTSVIRDLGASGILGLQAPIDHGGQNLNNRDVVRVIEQLGAIDGSVSALVVVHNFLGIRPIMRYASETVRNTLLPRLATGEQLAAFALTEAGAGSDLRAIQTSAARQDDGSWVLHGDKAWIGLAAQAAVVNVFAATPAANDSGGGLTGFIVSCDSPGLTFGPASPTMGLRGISNNAVCLDHVRVAGECLLHTPGNAMDVVRDALNHGRLGVAATSAGAMKRCLQAMKQHAGSRFVATGRLLDNPWTRHRLDHLTMAATAVSIVANRIGRALDAGAAVPDEVFMAAKIAGSEYLWETADAQVQLLGGRGYVETDAAPQFLRDARVSRIFEGPTESLTMFVGSSLVHRAETMCEFLRTKFYSSVVADALQHAASEIDVACRESPGDLNHVNRQWSCMLVGNLAVHGIVWAAVDGAAGLLQSESHAAVSVWAANQFTRARERAISRAGRRLSTFAVGTVASRIDAFSQAIGDLSSDIDDAVPGGDDGIGAVVMPESAACASTSTDRTGAAVAWLTTYLAAKLNIPAVSIDSGRSLLDYGLDSVLAVQVVGEINEHYDDKIENADVLWRFPSIIALAAYLVGDAQTHVVMETIPNSADVAVSDDAPHRDAVHYTHNNGEIPIEYYRFEALPPVSAMRRRKLDFDALRVEEPYFREVAAGNRNTVEIANRTYVNFNSYNYLGLSGDAGISRAAQDAIARYGTSVSASRIASGENALHRELEREIAGLIGAEASVAFVSGHATNVTTIGHLFGKDDLVVHDSLIHDSVVQGCRLSGARRLAFPHNDWQALDRLLATERSQHRRALVVIEGAYSMDGDIPDIPRFIEIRSRHKLFLMIDEAHSIGILGDQGGGIREYFDLDPADVDLWMGTLSKAFASCGGYIAGGSAVIEYLKYTAPGFLYSAGMSPANAAAALAALRAMTARPACIAVLKARARLFWELATDRGFTIPNDGHAAVMPVVIGDSQTCLMVAKKLFDNGIYVVPILHPAVAVDAARLRFFITAMHTEDQIRQTVDCLATVMSHLEKPADIANRIDAVT